MFNLVKRPCFVNRRCDKMYSNRRMPTESEKGKRFKKEFQEKVRTFKDNSKNGGKTLLVRASPVGHSPTTLHTHEVTGSSPVVSTRNKNTTQRVVFLFLMKQGTRTHLNARCRWHLAATSSQTGGNHTLCPLAKRPSSPVVSGVRTFYKT